MLVLIGSKKTFLLHICIIDYAFSADSYFLLRLIGLANFLFSLRVLHLLRSPHLFSIVNLSPQSHDLLKIDNFYL